MGNVIARFDGTDPDSPVVMAFAHLDQLGFIVRKIESDGYIQVDRLGGIPEKVLPGLNVRILTRKGTYVDGVFGNKSHHTSLPEDKYKVDLVTSLLIDVGVRILPLRSRTFRILYSLAACWPRCCIESMRPSI